MKARLAALGLLWCACWNFRAEIDGRCRDGGLTDCPNDAGDSDAGHSFSCGDHRCVWDGASRRGHCFNGWCWENPLPQGNDLFTVWGSAPDDVWAAGAHGMLMRWNGTSWTSYQGEVPTTHSWRGLAGQGRDSVWLVGVPDASAEAPGPQHFDGVRWAAEPWPAAFRAELLAVAADDAGHVVASGRDGLFGARGAGGWQPRRIGKVREHAVGLAFDAPGSCWALLTEVSQGVGVKRCDSEDGGFDGTWLADFTFYGLTSTEPGVLWIAGGHNGEGFLGQRNPNWTDLWSHVWNGGSPLVGITSSGEDVLACGDDTVLDGQLTGVEPAPPARLRAIWSAPARSSAWAVGERGDLLRSTVPPTWTEFQPAVKTEIRSLWVGRDFELAASENGEAAVPYPSAPGWRQRHVGDAGRGIEDFWIDAEATFGVAVGGDGIFESATPLDLSSYALRFDADAGPYKAVWGTSPTDVWALTSNGVRVHLGDAGWEDLTDLHVTFSDIDGTGPQRGFMVGRNGAALRLGAGGLWELALLSPVHDLNAVWVTPVGSNAEAIAVGDGIYRYRDGGWQTVRERGDELFASVWGFDEDDFYVVGGHGLVLHYRDGVPTPLDIGTEADLLTVRGRADGGTRELWVGGRGGAVLHAFVP